MGLMINAQHLRDWDGFIYMFKPVLRHHHAVVLHRHGCTAGLETDVNINVAIMLQWTLANNVADRICPFC